jgi:hypothetical protein
MELISDLPYLSGKWEMECSYIKILISEKKEADEKSIQRLI